MKKIPTILVTLSIIRGIPEIIIHETFEPEIHIGRHPACQLRLPGNLKSVSRKHASIIREGNRFRLIDTSTNGTFVKDEPVSQPYYLQSGDIMDLTLGGPKVSFVTTYLTDEPCAETAGSQPALVPERMPEKSPSNIQSVVPPKSAPPSFAFSETPAPGEPPESINAKVDAPLHIQYGPTLRTVNKLPAVLGQKGDCDIIIAHPMIAPHHLQISYVGNSYIVNDISEHALVRLNSQPFVNQTPLTPGDAISLTEHGPFFMFLEGGRLVEVSGAPQQESPPLEQPGKPQIKQQHSLSRTPISIARQFIFRRLFKGLENK